MIRNALYFNKATVNLAHKSQIRVKERWQAEVEEISEW